MIKQLKVYEMEDAFNLPKIDFNDWSNPVAIELADNGFDFLSRLLLSKDNLYRVSDLADNKSEIIQAFKTDFKEKATTDFISAVLKIYSITNDLVEFSNIKDSEDIMVIAHNKKNGKNRLCLYILKKIMNVVLSEREIIEVIGKELTAFDYNKLASMLLSEDALFDLANLEDARKEIIHALRYKFMSKKTMEFVSFLNKLYLNSKQNKSDFIFLMDLLKLETH